MLRLHVPRPDYECWIQILGVGDVEWCDHGNHSRDCEEMKAESLRLPEWIDEEWRENKQLSVGWRMGRILF